MRILLVLVALLLSPLAVSAQTLPGMTEAPASSDADIETLVRILENEQSRALLIERLQQTAGGETPIEAEAGNDLSIARQLAEYTRAMAEGTSATLRELGQLSVDVGQGIAGAGNADFAALRDGAIGVLLTGIGLIGSFLVLRIVVRWLQGGIGGRVAGRGWILRIAGAFGGAAMRSVLAPRAEPLRLLPVSDSNAAYWSFWLGRVVSLLGYAFMFVSPLVATNLSLATGGGVTRLFDERGISTPTQRVSYIPEAVATVRGLRAVGQAPSS